MQNSQLNRVLKLVKRTGDKLVIFDKDTDSGYAVMDLDQYESILDEAGLLALDSDSDESDEDFLPTRSARDFEPLGSVIKNRWSGDRVNSSLVEKSFTESEENGLEEELTTDDTDVLDEQPSISTIVEEAEITDENISDINQNTEEIPLNDVSHDEEEETFLLEPVE